MTYLRMSLNNPDYSRAKNIYEFSVLGLKGEHIKLDVYKGHVCIIVNIATKSPFTNSHYKQFNELLDKFQESKSRHCSDVMFVFLIYR